MLTEGRNLYLESFVSVKDFGAVGNGITNDTVSLQNALVEAQTNGKILLIPEGTYKYTETINIESPWVTLRGTNSSASVLLFGIKSPKLKSLKTRFIWRVGMITMPPKPLIFKGFGGVFATRDHSLTTYANA